MIREFYYISADHFEDQFALKPFGLFGLNSNGLL